MNRGFLNRLGVVLASGIVVVWTYILICVYTTPRQPAFIELPPGAYGASVGIRYPFWHFKSYYLSFTGESEYWLYDEYGDSVNLEDSPFWTEFFESTKPATIEIDNYEESDPIYYEEDGSGGGKDY